MNDVLLAGNHFDTPTMAATRDGFGSGVLEAGRTDSRIVVLSADLAESTRCEAFANEFPERFIEMGVAEQNMAGVAAGLAAAGKIPFMTSYAAFSPGRNWEQIRTTIALNDVPVVVCGMHAGVSVGPDGATHQMLEDIALMRALPNMTVISPCDSEEARKATLAVAASGKPAYLRFGREKTPVMTTRETPFAIGKAIIVRSPQPVDSSNAEARSHQSVVGSTVGAALRTVALIATGPLLSQALLAARILENEGIGATVVNVHTIKPLDSETIVAVARECGAVVTIEEHQVTGGLGSAIAECLAREAPTPIEFIGVQDRFGQSGTMMELYEEYGLTAPHIVAAAKRAIVRRT